MSEDELIIAFKKLIRHLQLMIGLQAIADFLMMYSFVKLFFVSGGFVTLFGRTLSQDNAIMVVIFLGLIDLTLTFIQRSDFKQGRALMAAAGDFSNGELQELIDRFKRYK
ncbi:hypothetical protein [uncultured Secundilactobacillus sp.]|uniref:hypothetical protein n=1 Tax=uncultured Secundilactobacillus sp. TaxID=2813935 RepID=UPI00258AD9D0|nr:hypothetical protein [uncultured Secundilactobacillus sp.]